MRRRRWTPRACAASAARSRPTARRTIRFRTFWDIELELDSALERGELSMHYQPKLRMSDLRPVGAEALMRWNSREPRQRAAGRLHPGRRTDRADQEADDLGANTALRAVRAMEAPVGPAVAGGQRAAELSPQHDLPDLVENALQAVGP